MEQSKDCEAAVDGHETDASAIESLIPFYPLFLYVAVAFQQVPDGIFAKDTTMKAFGKVSSLVGGTVSLPLAAAEVGIQSLDIIMKPLELRQCRLQVGDGPSGTLQPLFHLGYAIDIRSHR